MIQGSIKRDKKSFDRRQFCTFYIAQRLFGVNITDVKDIQPPVKFTPVFHAVKEVKGFVNIRGHIHLVIDLRRLLGFGGKDIDKLNQIVLFKPHVGESFGILVDSVGDVVEVGEDRVENLGEKGHEIMEGGMQDASDLITGVCKLKDELLMILDSPVLIEKIRKMHSS